MLSSSFFGCRHVLDSDWSIFFTYRVGIFTMIEGTAFDDVVTDFRYLTGQLIADKINVKLIHKQEI